MAAPEAEDSLQSIRFRWQTLQGSWCLGSAVVRTAAAGRRREEETSAVFVEVLGVLIQAAVDLRRVCGTAVR